jgi:hypothetical protein
MPYSDWTITSELPGKFRKARRWHCRDSNRRHPSYNQELLAVSTYLVIKLLDLKFSLSHCYLKYDSVSSDRCFVTFRKKVLTPSLKSKRSERLARSKRQTFSWFIARLALQPWERKQYTPLNVNLLLPDYRRHIAQYWIRRYEDLFKISPFSDALFLCWDRIASFEHLQSIPQFYDI